MGVKILFGSRNRVLARAPYISASVPVNSCSLFMIITPVLPSGEFRGFFPKSPTANNFVYRPDVLPRPESAHLRVHSQNPHIRIGSRGPVGIMSFEDKMIRRREQK